MSRIEVWCLGEAEELLGYSHIMIEPRNPSSGGFARAFKARIFLNDLLQIDSAAELLYEVSYKLSC